MNELNLSIEDRDVVAPALQKAELEDKDVISLKLPNGKLLQAKNGYIKSC